MGTGRTHYDVLGVEPAAEAVAIKRAWKVLMQVWHPDRFSGEMREEAQRASSRINEAYSVLRDPMRRAAYDRRLMSASQTSTPGAAETEPTKPFARGPFGRTAISDRTAEPRRSQAQIHRESSFAHVFAEGATALWHALQRYPRVATAAAAVWVVVLGGGLVMHLAAGPSMPIGTLQTSAAASDAYAQAAAEAEADTADLARQADAIEAQAAEANAVDEGAGAQASEESAAPEAQAPTGEIHAPEAAVDQASPYPDAAAQAPGPRVLRIVPNAG